ncbi:MAG: class I SAM-dependent methyltransferase [Nocardioides sp.]
MATEDSVRIWDDEADAFDLPADHGLTDPEVRGAWHKLLSENVPPPPARIADLGCGTGTLTVLLAEAGYEVDGLDFSPRMLEIARSKGAALAGAHFIHGDAFDPPLRPSLYDVVLCRHVLWAMPDPALALSRWVDLLAPGGRLVLIEGNWSNGAGLSAEQTIELVEGSGREARLVRLPDAVYWGRDITDDRYLVVSAGS